VWGDQGWGSAWNWRRGIDLVAAQMDAAKWINQMVASVVVAAAVLAVPVILSALVEVPSSLHYHQYGCDRAEQHTTVQNKHYTIHVMCTYIHVTAV